MQHAHDNAHLSSVTLRHSLGVIAMLRVEEVQASKFTLLRPVTGSSTTGHFDGVSESVMDGSTYFPSTLLLLESSSGEQKSEASPCRKVVIWVGVGGEQGEGGGVSGWLTSPLHMLASLPQPATMQKPRLSDGSTPGTFSSTCIVTSNLRED